MPCSVLKSQTPVLLLIDFSATCHLLFSMKVNMAWCYDITRSSICQFCNALEAVEMPLSLFLLVDLLKIILFFLAA